MQMLKNVGRLVCRAGAVRIAVAAMVTLVALPGFAHEYKAGDLAIDHPWSRETPAQAQVAAGYLVVRNAGAAPDRLVSVTGEIAGRAEIHEMSVDSAGVMRMRPLADGVEIPAGAEVALAPGGYHIMFFDLNRRPVAGERFSGTLTFEKAGTVDVEFAVDAAGEKPKPDAGHDAHAGHGG